MPSLAAFLDTAGRALQKRMALLRDRGEPRTLNSEMFATLLG
jgi:hypothetical protein